MTTQQHDLMALCPEQDWLMQLAWIGGLRFALEDDGMVTEYRQHSGDQWQPALTPIDQMVDEATGRDWVFLSSFIKWFNENVWGGMEAMLNDEEPDAGEPARDWPCAIEGTDLIACYQLPPCDKHLCTFDQCNCGKAVC